MVCCAPGGAGAHLAGLSLAPQSTAVGTASCMTRGDVVYVRPARVQASRHVLAVVVAGDPHSGPISLPDEWQAHVPETDDNKIVRC